MKECVREKFPKNSEVTRTKISSECNIPWRTVDNHFESILGQDLGDGTKVVWGRACYDAMIRDPPGDDEIVVEVDPSADKVDSPRGDFGAGLLVGVIIVGVADLVIRAILQRGDHIHSWSPMRDADSWILVCITCGGHGWNLSDQSAPIHFAPVNS